MEIRPTRAELFRADGHDAANGRFSPFQLNVLSCSMQRKGDYVSVLQELISLRNRDHMCVFTASYELNLYKYRSN